MNNAIKAYLFVPSGVRNYLESGFEGWRFVFVIYFAFAGILAFQTAGDFKTGLVIFLQPIILFILLTLLSVAGAFAIGAKEPLIKGLRLVALCLPPLGLTIYSLAEQSPLLYFGVYAAVLFVFGMVFLGPKGKFINGAMGLGIVSLVLVLFYLQAETSARWLDRKVTVDGYVVRVDELPTFNKVEMDIYRFILLDTPRLGHMPRVDEISDSLKIDGESVRNALAKLDGKGRVVMSADGEIRYAFPWAALNHGYSVSVRFTPDGPVLGPIYAASAIHALAVSALYKGAFVKVISYIKDTNEPLILEISDGQISGCSCRDALVYMSDSFSKIEFYSSISGAKLKYHGRFDSTRLLDLERAMQVAGKKLEEESAGAL